MSYETLDELSDEILDLVKDTSYTASDTWSLINKGLKEISGRVYLPNLETDNTVTTDTSENHVSLPTGYQKALLRCYSTTNKRKIRIYNSVALLLRQYGQVDRSGNVTGVAVRGSDLYYQPIPSSAETLRVHYYEAPTALSSASHQPTCLPEHLVRPLLVNYGCKEIYKQIERGIAGPKPQTEYYTAEFEKAMIDLVEFIGPFAPEPPEVRDELVLDSFLRV